MIFALSAIPLFGIIGTSIYVYYYGIVWQEPILMIVGWLLSGMGITLGYHRLFAHKSFKAHPAIQFIAMLCGSAALQNNVIKWCSDHRRHHKHLDTDKDPYSITKGFFHAHIGWILKNKPSPLGKIQDLEENPALQFQDKYYVHLFIIFGILFPLSLGFIWNRPVGALFWGVLLRITLVHHFTYFINSLCHFVLGRYTNIPFDSFS